MTFLYVALGGAIGALLRYCISLIPIKSEFPVLTFLTNIAGALLIGIIVGFAENKENVPAFFNPFFKTGICGGFTTFSTFSLESFQLFEEGKIFTGSVYVVASFMLCIIGVFIGKYIGNKL